MSTYLLSVEILGSDQVDQRQQVVNSSFFPAEVIPLNCFASKLDVSSHCVVLFDPCRMSSVKGFNFPASFVNVVLPANDVYLGQSIDGTISDLFCKGSVNLFIVANMFG